MAQSTISNREKARGRESFEKRRAQHAEHVDQKRELQREQQELAKTIKNLEKELKVVLRALDTGPREKITIKRDKVNGTVSLNHIFEMSPSQFKDEMNIKRDELEEAIKEMKSKKGDTTHEIDILRRLVWLENVGSDLRHFLAEPKNLGVIALILAMTPGMGIMGDILRRGQQAPEIQLMLSGIFAGGLTAIGSELWLLIKRFKEVQKEVQDKIDYWREILGQKESESL